MKKQKIHETEIVGERTALDPFSNVDKNFPKYCPLFSCNKTLVNMNSKLTLIVVPILLM